MVAEGRSEQDGSQQYRAAEYEDMLPDAVEAPPTAKPKKVAARPAQSAQQLVEAEKRKSDEQLIALRAEHAGELKAQAEKARHEHARRLEKAKSGSMSAGVLLGMILVLIIGAVAYNTNTDLFGYQITKKSDGDRSSSSINVPEVNGLSADAAAVSLRDRGFNVTRMTVPNSQTAGSAVSTYPIGATSPDTPVTLYVSSGPSTPVVTASPVPSTSAPQPPTTLDIPGVGPIVIPGSS